MKLDPRIVGRIGIALGLAGLLILLCGSAVAHEINLRTIAQIESSGGKFLVGDQGAALGIYQIQSALVQDFNRVNRASLSHRDVMAREVSDRVAHWAFSKYFPIILKQLKKPATTENLLVCWNAGCGALKRKQLPKITQHYLIKYNQLSKGE